MFLLKLCVHLHTIIYSLMAQLILQVDDNALLPDLKKAVELLRGVVSVTVKKEETPSKETVESIMEARQGDFAGELDASSKEKLKASIMAL